MLRHSGIPNDVLRFRNMDTHKRARKNDSIDATQNAPTHHTNEKKMQTDRETKYETNDEKDTNDLGSTGDESEDGQSSITHNDQDSDISFENDTDEEIDTTVIEEEDWIEYIENNTDEAMEKMENKKIRCRNKTHKRMEWRLALRIVEP